MLTSVDNDLWLAMWKNSQTDFHQVLVNQQLQDHWHKLDIPTMGRVLVPLCGKSNDMIWLAAEGFQVIGIELSAIAVKAFFVENNLKPKKTRVGNFTVWRHGRISIYCGDIFLLKGSNLGMIDAIYDRAALTALPVELRKLYVTKLMSFMPLLKPMLLLTTEDADPQRNQNSPAIIDQEVAVLYSPYFDIDVRYGDQYVGEFQKETVNKVYQMTRLATVTQ
ncbi:thiopurine S-methyltransferase [uncultured Tolumonas sp.]|uniref:thiopurine S-methyltransferase n=1 Tax=uncultured Tolumonas sp. TaxID=263765 RepID=UPI002A0A6A19|nr:thiopurine S-methyltransferase [uncultured Tolumonas sp.]